MRNNKKIVLMAIATGQETKEGVFNKVHMGVAACNLLAVNPTKNQLAILLGTEDKPANIDKEPEYLFEDENGVKSIRVEFLLKVITEDENAPAITKRVSYFVRNEKNFNTDKTKVQVINAYGDTAWLTQEEFKEKKGPSYAPDYSLVGARPALKGEEDLVRFIKKFMNIPNYSIFKSSGERTVHSDPESCECQLGELPKYFTGDVSEVRNALNIRKTNKVKMLFGAKVTDDNKVYQDCYTRYPMNFNMRGYEYLKKNLDDTLKGGGYPKTQFGAFPYPFVEYTPKPTPLETAVPDTAWGPAPTPSANTLPDAWGAAPQDDLPFN
jgi:hypothetical protein